MLSVTPLYSSKARYAAEEAAGWVCTDKDGTEHEA